MIQALCLALAGLYLLDRLVKYFAVLAFFSARTSGSPGQSATVAVLQPILSGDPKLPDTLSHNLRLERFRPKEFIWLIDDDDAEAMNICQRLVREHPDQRIRITTIPRGPTDASPKMIKLQHGLAIADSERIAVLDDDTMLHDDDIDQCLAHLDDKRVGLVFGIPFYTAFDTWPSSVVSVFVNSNSLMTYLPYTFLSAPFTINGMFYVMRREALHRVGDFDGLEPILADDFAVAQRFVRGGYILCQSQLRHGIYTHVDTWRDYFALIKRWLVFPRETVMRDLSWYDLGVAYCLALLPCLLPLAVLLTAIFAASAASWFAVALCALVQLAVFLDLDRRFLYKATPLSRAFLVPVVQIVIPIQLLIALVMPQRIRWRGHLIQVQPGGTFEILCHRTSVAPEPQAIGAQESPADGKDVSTHEV